MDQIEKVKFFAVSGFLVLALAIVVVHNNNISNQFGGDGGVRVSASESCTSFNTPNGFTVNSSNYSSCKNNGCDTPLKLSGGSCVCNGTQCDSTTSVSCDSLVRASGYNTESYCMALSRPECKWRGTYCEGSTRIGPTRSYCVGIKDAGTCGRAWGLCSWTVENLYTCQNKPNYEAACKSLNNGTPAENYRLCVSEGGQMGCFWVDSTNNNEVAQRFEDGDTCVYRTQIHNRASSLNNPSNNFNPAAGGVTSGGTGNVSDRAPMWSPNGAFQAVPMNNTITNTSAQQNPTTQNYYANNPSAMPQSYGMGGWMNPATGNYCAPGTQC